MPTGVVPADIPSFRLCGRSGPPGPSDPLRGFRIHRQPTLPPPFLTKLPCIIGIGRPMTMKTRLGLRVSGHSSGPEYRDGGKRGNPNPATGRNTDREREAGATDLE